MIFNCQTRESLEKGIDTLLSRGFYLKIRNRYPSLSKGFYLKMIEKLLIQSNLKKDLNKEVELFH